MAALHELPHQDEDGPPRAVVEVPKGARVKTKWDPELGAMAAGRTLPLGLSYPFVLRIDQKGSKRRVRNDRLATRPVELARWGQISEVRDLAPRMRQEVEKFCPDTTFFTAKDARSLGFAGPGAARRLVRDAVDAYEKER